MNYASSENYLLKVLGKSVGLCKTILRILVIVCPSYQAVLALTLFYIYSERN